MILAILRQTEIYNDKISKNHLHKFFTGELLNTMKQHYAKFQNFPYLCAFITIPYKEWPKRKPYMYAQIADKTHPNGWVNARRADNGTLM